MCLDLSDCALTLLFLLALDIVSLLVTIVFLLINSIFLKSTLEESYNNYDYYFKGTLIRLCIDEDKTLEYDDGSFEYNYYLEVRVNEQLWMDYSYEPQN